MHITSPPRAAHGAVRAFRRSRIKPLALPRCRLLEPRASRLGPRASARPSRLAAALKRAPRMPIVARLGPAAGWAEQAQHGPPASALPLGIPPHHIGLCGLGGPGRLVPVDRPARAPVAALRPACGGRCAARRSGVAPERAPHGLGEPAHLAAGPLGPGGWRGRGAGHLRHRSLLRAGRGRRGALARDRLPAAVLCRRARPHDRGGDPGGGARDDAGCAPGRRRCAGGAAADLATSGGRCCPGSGERLRRSRAGAPDRAPDGRARARSRAHFRLAGRRAAAVS